MSATLDPPRDGGFRNDIVGKDVTKPTVQSRLPVHTCPSWPGGRCSWPGLIAVVTIVQVVALVLLAPGGATGNGSVGGACTLTPVSAVECCPPTRDSRPTEPVLGHRAAERWPHGIRRCRRRRRRRSPVV